MCRPQNTHPISCFVVDHIYVDDLTLAGGCQDIQNQFWDELKTRIKIDPPEYITEKGAKILGRIHKIKRTPELNTMTYDMTAYAKGIVEFFCEVTDVPKEKLRSVTTPCLPEANMCDEELENEGQLSKFASRILMRCLWLSRLCRPDIAFAVQRLCKQSDSLDEMGRQTDISSCQLFAFNLQSCYEVDCRPITAAVLACVYGFRLRIVSLHSKKYIRYCICHKVW